MNVRAVLVLVLLMLVPAGSYMSDGRFRDARGNTDPDAVHVVVPDDLDALDPQVRDHLMRQIEWARDDPQDASRHATLGIAYAANARWLESRESFRMVLKLDPGEVLAKYHMAVATERLGDYDGTVELLRQITLEHPDFAPAFHRIGALLLERGSEQEAESAFRQAVTLAPELPHGYIGLAKVALRADDMHKVIKLLTRALKLEPRSRTAHYLLGTAYRRLGRRADAERELRRGADAKKRYMPTEWSRRIPEHAMGVPFQIRQAQRYLHNGRRKRAIEVLETVLKWHPDCVEALNDLAVVHMRQREPVKARELLQKALKFDKTSAVTYINLGASYLDTAEPDEALRHLDRAIELSPTTAQAHITRAVALLRLRRVAEAAEAQKTAVGLDPQNPAFHMDLGNTLVLLRRYAEAKEQYETVIVQTPDSVEAHLRLCAVSIALGDEERAASSLAEARRLAPNHPKVKTLARKLEALRK